MSGSGMQESMFQARLSRNDTAVTHKRSVDRIRRRAADRANRNAGSGIGTMLTGGINDDEDLLSILGGGVTSG